MDEVDCAVSLIEVAVDILTVGAVDCGVYESEVDVILDERVEFAEVLNKFIRVSVIYVEEELLPCSQKVTSTFSVL